MAVIMSRFMTVRERVSGKMLGDYAEGDIVLLNESGSPVEFYVAKHDYERGLNGAGRTLLLRKDCYDTRPWNSAGVNTYATSSLDTWLNGAYKALLDKAVQDALGATKFYYTPGNYNTTVTTLARSVFQLSLTEFGLSSNAANTEGSALPIANTIRQAYYGGSVISQWTRSASTHNTDGANLVYTDRNALSSGCTNYYGSRPVFTLPSTALFDEETKEFKGVA